MMAGIFQSFLYSLQKKVIDIKLYVILAVVGVALLIVTNPISRFLLSASTSINILEIFPLVFSQFHLVIIFSIGYIVLLSDAPFIGEEDAYFILRCSKLQYALGQVLFIVFMAVFYYGFIVLVSALPLLSQGYIGDKWSEATYLLANTSAAAEENVGLTYPSTVMWNIDVVKVFYHTVLLMISGNMMLGTLFYLLSSFSKKAFGFLAILGLFALSMFIDWMFLPRIFKHLSLLAQLMLAVHNFGFSYGQPTIPESYIVFIVLSVIFSFGAIRRTRRLDVLLRK